VILGLELFFPIVRGDGCAGDLEREAVRGQLPVHLAVMSRSKRSSKLFEDVALMSRVFRIFMDGARVVKVTPAVLTIWGLGSKFDLDLALHVAGRYMSYIPQAKWHTGE
jgi:hypothetical protein